MANQMGRLRQSKVYLFDGESESPGKGFDELCFLCTAPQGERMIHAWTGSVDDVIITHIAH